MDQTRGYDVARRGWSIYIPCAPSIASSMLTYIIFELQRALANQPWKEYTAEGGRKYWYNTETKQSSWEMPDVYKRALGGGGDGTPTTPM